MPAVVIMGPSGCGKTTIASALAHAMGWRYIEGDALHPPSNVAKMSAGQPLSDADREPWLAAVATAMGDASASGAVVACSALKRRYRDTLRRGGDVTFVLPLVPRDALARRLGQRTGHYMPASLLDSQLADLEPLGPDESGFSIEGAAPLLDQIGTIRSRLRA